MQTAATTPSTEKYIPLVIAAVITAAILAVCFPGFMSYDSIRMLEEARAQVRGGIYPAMPVYILRLFDIGGHGPTIMLIAQNFLLLFSLSALLHILKVRWLGSLMAIIAILAMPTVIGCMLVLWKDVTTAALMLAALIMIFWSRRAVVSEKTRLMVKWSAVFFLLIATLVRFNAMTATAAIVAYWITVFYRGRSKTVKGVVFALFLATMAASNAVVNNYSFPNLRKLTPNELVYGIMTYDLLGISKWSGKSYLPIQTPEYPDLPRIPLQDIDLVYSSLGVIHIYIRNQELGNPVQFYPPRHQPSDIVRNWLGAIEQNPGAYLRYRWDLFAELVGAKPHATFEPTHFNRIDGNSFGIKAEPNVLADYVTAYIAEASGSIFGKPWVFLLVSYMLTIVVLTRRRVPNDTRRLAGYATVASIMYLAPIFFMTGTGEVRYTFPSLVLSTVPVIISLFGSRRSNDAPRLEQSGLVTHKEAITE